MEIYRIVLEIHSKTLYASGKEARWNSNGNFVIYTANSRSLACLENVVHRGGVGLSDAFRTMVIYVPANVGHTTISIHQLPANWSDPTDYSICQRIGDNWYKNQNSAVLKVPSAIIKNEYNFIINTRHPDYNKIKLMDTEDFAFDTRIKGII